MFIIIIGESLEVMKETFQVRNEDSYQLKQRSDIPSV